jgi:hypothetical protein
MRRVALYLIGWVAAAAVAVLLAWQGVGLVGRNVTDNHPRALTADEARQALEEGGSSPAGGSPDPSPTTTAPTGGGGSPAGSGTTGTTGMRPRATATTRPSTTTPTYPSTTRPGVPAPTPTTGGSVVRTYNLVGGSTAVRFNPSGAVTVVWANPNPGFRADIDDRDGGGVRVRFDGDSGRSQVEAWWDGGPQDRVEERGGEGGSGRG